jgi:hypothetical protein
MACLEEAECILFRTRREDDRKTKTTRAYLAGLAEEDVMAQGGCKEEPDGRDEEEVKEAFV